MGDELEKRWYSGEKNDAPSTNRGARADANDTAAKWYGVEKNDAPIIDRAGWQYVPHANPRYGGHWVDTRPITLDGFVMTNRNAKP